jgi:hypothetical protein
VNKKKQKNFIHLHPPHALGALQGNEGFLLLFSKKEAFPFFSWTVHAARPREMRHHVSRCGKAR